MKKSLFFLLLIYSGLLESQNIITTAVGNGSAGNTGDGGLATSAQINVTNAVVFDTTGNLYFADAGSNCVRKVNSSGIITTIAGTGVAGYSGDGGPAISALLSGPQGIAVDDSNNIYVADYNNSRIRKINSAGIITTIAGNTTCGYGGDGGPATSAQLCAPIGMTFDSFGNMYIADYANNRVRKINTNGIITTIAGTGVGGYNGDNILATSAKLNTPAGLVFDISGNLLITDMANERIRKIDNSGIITTIAGTGVGGYSGDNNLATLAELLIPAGITVDGIGNIFFCDANNNVIRKINATGIITTIVGNGFGAGRVCTGTYTGDNIAATLATLSDPGGVAFDKNGNLFIADGCNYRIRKVTNIANINEPINFNGQIFIYPNPTSDQFFIDANTNNKLTVDLHDVNGRHVLSTNVNDKSSINVSTFDVGVYTLTIKTAARVINKKLVILH